MMRSGLIAMLTICCPTGAAGQPAASDPLEPIHWGNVYKLPAMDRVQVKSGVTYLKDATGELRMDVYSPPATSRALRPAVVFINGIGDGAPIKPKDWPIYRDWARLAAAEGMVGITMEADAARIPQSISALFSYLAQNGQRHGIDSARVGLFAASANATEAGRYMLGSTAIKGLKAAVLYYGVAPQAQPRPDLPVLFIVAEGDVARPLVGGYQALWGRVMAARAPWTITYASGQPHAFDGFSDDPEARRLVAQTLGFLKSNLEDPPQLPRTAHVEERRILDAVYMNDHPRSAELLRAYLRRYPDHPVATAQLGRALVMQQRHDEVISLLEPVVQRQPANAQMLNNLAQSYSAKGRHADAAKAYRTAIDKGFRNGQAYQQLALAELAAGNWDAAIAAFEQGIGAGMPKGTSLYNIACVQAKAGRIDAAFVSLNQAIKDGFSDKATLESDPDLASLRGDPRWAMLVKQLT